MPLICLRSLGVAPCLPCTGLCSCALCCAVRCVVLCCVCVVCVRLCMWCPYADAYTCVCACVLLPLSPPLTVCVVALALASIGLAWQPCPGVLRAGQVPDGWRHGHFSRQLCVRIIQTCDRSLHTNNGSGRWHDAALLLLPPPLLLLLPLPPPPSPPLLPLLLLLHLLLMLLLLEWWLLPTWLPSGKRNQLQRRLCGADASVVSRSRCCCCCRCCCC